MTHLKLIPGGARLPPMGKGSDFEEIPCTCARCWGVVMVKSGPRGSKVHSRASCPYCGHEWTGTVHRGKNA